MSYIRSGSNPEGLYIFGNGTDVEIETKYLRFKEVPNVVGRKTKIIIVISKSKNLPLGQIRWYSQWRQYTFAPAPGFHTIYNKDCLRDIAQVIEDLMEDRKKARD